MRHAIFMVLLVGFMVGPAGAAEDYEPAPKEKWAFQGPFGTFDRASAQRGFQVFKEVCSSCHSIALMRYRNLKALGFSDKEVKAIAAEYEVQDGPNDEGEMFTRKAEPNDRFFQPYDNENAARAANAGAYPVDLSLITKARKQGADYVYALLTGYGKEKPADVEIFPGKHYNPYFPGMQISMAAPLSEGMVTYDDGTPATTAQMAKDVTQFLAWVAEPELESRKQMGIRFLLLIGVLTVLLYLVKKHIWSRVK